MLDFQGFFNIFTRNYRISVTLSTSQHLCKAPIYVDDTNDSTLKSIKEKCIRLKNEHDLGFVLIDYLQLIRYQDRNTESDMKIILRELKGLAHELDCPVLVISEISPDKSYDGSICPDDMYDYIHFLDYVLFMTRDNMVFSVKSQDNVSVVTVVRHRDGVIGKMKYENRGNSLPRRI